MKPLVTEVWDLHRKFFGVEGEIVGVAREYGVRAIVGDKFSGATWQSLIRAAGGAYESANAARPTSYTTRCRC